MQMKLYDSYAVTEVISLILVVSLIISTVAGILFWALPYIDSRKTETRVESAVIQFTNIDKVFQDVLFQGPNCSRYANFVTDSGSVELSSKGDRIIVFYPLVSNCYINVSGLDDNEDFRVDITHDTLDPPFNLNVNYLYPTVPSNEQFSIAAEGGDQIDTGSTLFDAVMMTITKNGADLGRIWLFDTGYIRYSTQAQSGTGYSILMENEGVIRGTESNSFLMDEPTTHSNNDSFVFRVLQLKPSADLTYSSMGGTVSIPLLTTESGNQNAIYSFLFRHNDTVLHENKANVPQTGVLKIKVYGDYADAWEWYFANTLELSTETYNSERYYAKSGGLTVTLLLSICDVSVEVVY